jgi:hypothetical protein
MIQGTVYGIIKLNEDVVLYVGSTANLDTRWHRHRSDSRNRKRKHHGYKVYVYIRNNGGIEQFTHIPLFAGYFRNLLHMRKTEEAYRKKHKAPLNSQKCYTGLSREEYTNQYNKKYYEANHERILARKREKVTCACGFQGQRSGSSKHKKSKKHNYNMKIKTICGKLLDELIKSISQEKSISILI